MGRSCLMDGKCTLDWNAYKKPVELVYIPDGDHVLVKPWERMTSQQGAVDWLSFWLKGEEDPDPAKAEQYKRWHELRKLQKKMKGTVWVRQFKTNGRLQPRYGSQGEIWRRTAV